MPRIQMYPSATDQALSSVLQRWNTLEYTSLRQAGKQMRAALSAAGYSPLREPMERAAVCALP